MVARVRAVVLALAVVASTAGCSGGAVATTRTASAAATPTAASPTPTPLFPGVAQEGSPEENFLVSIQSATDMSTAASESAILAWGNSYCAEGLSGTTRTAAAKAADAEVATIHDTAVRRAVLKAADAALCPGWVHADLTPAEKKAAAVKAAKEKAIAAAAEKKAKAKALRKKRAAETYIFVRASSGEANSITYSIDGSMQQHTYVSLPWRHKISEDVSPSDVVIVAQNAGGGSITCGFEDGNGETWNTHTSTGQYAVVSCN